MCFAFFVFQIIINVLAVVFSAARKGCSHMAEGKAHMVHSKDRTQAYMARTVHSKAHMAHTVRMAPVPVLQSLQGTDLGKLCRLRSAAAARRRNR